jgi:hypothetical protein
MSAVTEADIKAIHPDYPTRPEILNVMYRDHTERVRDYFADQVREQIEAQIKAEREGFLSSSGLDPTWVAGWHSAVDHVRARIARGVTS